MSRLFRERVLIALSPGGVAAARVAGIFRPRIVGQLRRDCDPGVGPERWRAATAALASIAQELAPIWADVTVVLSNHFVRYALVPHSTNLESDAHDMAFARYCFSRIHGDRGGSWETRLSGSSDRGIRVASAVDAALPEAVRACFPAHGKPRLVSLQPYLMAAFNRGRRLMKGASAWLLLLEPGRGCLARLERGSWAGVQNVKGAFDGPRQWAALLDRERYLANGTQTPVEVLVCMNRGADRQERVAGPWRFRRLPAVALPGLATPCDEALSMALCAL